VFIPESDESAGAERVPTEEERRLFFVAMTRARHGLFITGSLRGVGRSGFEEQRRPLPFIAEITNVRVSASGADKPTI